MVNTMACMIEIKIPDTFAHLLDGRALDIAQCLDRNSFGRDCEREWDGGVPEA
jgi:hypothetical protein